MNKIILFITLNILITVCFGQSQCTLELVRANGATCNSDETCKNGYCNQGICAPFTAKLGSCSTSTQCISGMTCQSNICNVTQFAFNQDPCSQTSDCVGSQSDIIECANNVCAIAASKQCKQAIDCDLNEYCNDVGACVDAGGIGATCTGRYDCINTLVCTYQNNTSTTLSCQNPWTKNANDKCNSTPDDERIPFFIDCDIGQNLICVDSKCVVNKPSASCATCNTATDCGMYETCVCNSKGATYQLAGKSGLCAADVLFTDSCKTTFGSLMNCAAENNCQMNQRILFNQGGCLYKNCQNLICPMSNCFRAVGTQLNIAEAACANYKAPANLEAGCSMFTPSPEPSSSNIINVPSILLFIILLVISLNF